MGGVRQIASVFHGRYAPRSLILKQRRSSWLSLLGSDARFWTRWRRSRWKRLRQLSRSDVLTAKCVTSVTPALSLRGKALCTGTSPSRRGTPETGYTSASRCWVHCAVSFSHLCLRSMMHERCRIRPSWRHSKCEKQGKCNVPMHVPIEAWKALLGLGPPEAAL